MKILIFLVLTILALLDGLLSLDVLCVHKKKTFLSIPNFDICDVVDDFHIQSIQDAYVGTTNLTKFEVSNLNGIRIYEKTCHYFPKNLENIFNKGLEAIEISLSHLKEISKQDLEPFAKLKILYLERNDIEILEDGIFDNNTALQKIFLEENKIKHVGMKVFANRTSLNYVNLLKNDCINIHKDTKQAVKDLWNLKNTSCNNVEYAKSYKNVKQLEINNQNMSLDDFRTFYDELTKIETSLISKFHNSSLLSRVQALKDRSFNVLWKNVTEINHLVSNLNQTISEEIKKVNENLGFYANNTEMLKNTITKNNLNLTEEFKIFKEEHQINFAPFWLGACSVLVVILIVVLYKNYFAEDRVISYTISDAKRYVKNERHDSLLL